jgi:hypothetical protein
MSSTGAAAGAGPRLFSRIDRSKVGTLETKKM